MRLPNYVQFVILWQPHCALRVAMTTAYLKAIMEVYGINIYRSGPKWSQTCNCEKGGDWLKSSAQFFQL